MKTKAPVLAVMLLGAMASVAAADDDSEDKFEPIGKYGQLGIGMVARSADAAMSTDGDQYGFDGTLKLGKVWKAHDRVRPGGFFEVRTVDFDTFEVAVGPQVQFKLADNLALQLRGGVGAEANGQSYALAGVGVGNALIGASATARRMFEDDETTIALNLEVPALAVLLPVGIVYLLAGGGDGFATR